MSAVNECFPVRCMKSLHGTHRSYRSPSQHQKQTNFSIYPCLAVQKSGRKEGKRSELLFRCWLWSLVCFPRASYGNKWVFWWSGSRKWMRSSWITVKLAQLRSRSPQARASARERERERERAAHYYCIRVTCVYCIMCMRIYRKPDKTHEECKEGFINPLL